MEPHIAANLLAVRLRLFRKRLGNVLRHQLPPHANHVVKEPGQPPASDHARLDPHRLHRLRIAIKKLRYAADFLQPAFASATFASKGAKPYIEATVRLQGALGAMNDRAVARHMLADLATAARPTEDVKKPLKRIAKQAGAGDKRRRRKLERAWKEFRKADKFW